MKSSHCLALSGINHPVMWYHIPEEWRPQQHSCRRL